VLARNQNDVTAATAIPTARTTSRDIFFTPKRETPVPAVARFDGDCDFVDEHVEDRRNFRGFNFRGSALRDDVDEFSESPSITKLDGARYRCE